ncbi:hypothetical protein BC834DRAFT_548904 [Gloeopeniophorella convolvens]|nr:hypothetical protein BC834DRAFT_548904 [Gloeopeniophorella convolvens]
MHPPGNSPPVCHEDILVDGFIAQAFAPAEADHYFTLLRESREASIASRSSQYWDMCYSDNAWHIRINPSQDAGRSSASKQYMPWSLLDYHIRLSEGTVVRQRRSWDRGVWPLSSVAVQSPVFFVSQEGILGYRLSDIISHGTDRSRLRGGDEIVSLSEGGTMYVRICWPGCRDWHCQVSTGWPTTLAHFMYLIGISVSSFISDPGQVTEPELASTWGIVSMDPNDSLHPDDVKIVGAIQVSTHSWQPIIQLERYVFWTGIDI